MNRHWTWLVCVFIKLWSSIRRILKIMSFNASTTWIISFRVTERSIYDKVLQQRVKIDQIPIFPFSRLVTKSSTVRPPYSHNHVHFVGFIFRTTALWLCTGVFVYAYNSYRWLNFSSAIQLDSAYTLSSFVSVPDVCKSEGW